MSNQTFILTFSVNKATMFSTVVFIVLTFQAMFFNINSYDTCMDLNGVKRKMNMNSESEITRLTKENETFRKIIETQQHTINLLIDHFIAGNTEKHSKKN